MDGGGGQWPCLYDLDGDEDDEDRVAEEVQGAPGVGHVPAAAEGASQQQLHIKDQEMVKARCVIWHVVMLLVGTACLRQQPQSHVRARVSALRTADGHTHIYT